MNSMREKAPLIKPSTVAKLMLVAGLLAALEGCPLLVVGAAGGGALVATDRRTVGTQTEDREIQVKTQVQLTNGLPDSAHVNVTVVNNVVLLTGEVPSDLVKKHAEDIARGVENVGAVVNQLAVLPASSFGSRSNDAYLEGRVKTALIGEKTVSANDFKVVSERGSIYLMGLVTNQEGAEGALVASQVTGVKEVVKVFTYISPQQAHDLSLDTRGSGTASNATSNATSSANASAGVAPGPGATVNPVADPSVSTQPLDVQTGAPITDSAPSTRSTVLK